MSIGISSFLWILVNLIIALNLLFKIMIFGLSIYRKFNWNLNFIVDFIVIITVK